MGKHKFSIDDRKFEVDVGTRRGTTVAVSVNGKSYTVELESMASAMALRATPSTPPPVATSTVSVPAGAASSVSTPSGSGGSGEVSAPMAGLVLAVKVKVGDQVEEGATLLILEAMKMENAITAPVAGTVRVVAVQAQQTVNQGDLMVDIA